MSGASEPVVIIRKDGPVGVVILSRPAKLNALTSNVLRDLHEALSTLVNARAIRAILITGAGTAFCAGQDLSERDPRGRSTPFDLEEIQRGSYHPILDLIRGADKPVIAAVNGLAAGAGAALALACDVVIARQSARFLFSFVRVGLSADAGLGWTLVKALGPARARALLMLGRELSATEAFQFGLIAECVTDDDFDARAHAVAQTLAHGPATALTSIKGVIEAASAAVDWRDYLQTEAQLQGKAGAHPDYAEGVLAFIEKRAPKWAGGE